MDFRIAGMNDKDNVFRFYEEVCQQQEFDEYTPDWEMGIYPTYEELQQHLSNGEVCLGELNGKIAMAGVISCGEDELYKQIKWNHETSPEEAGVLHLFACHPHYRGQGLSHEMILFLLQQLKSRGMKVCHLDALHDNVRASNVYNHLGFEATGTFTVHYDDLGDVAVDLFEYDLSNILFSIFHSLIPVISGHDLVNVIDDTHFLYCP